MKIANYLSSLLPSFGKDRITEDCRVTRGEIKEYTEPAYNIAAPLLKTWKFKSKKSEAIREMFDRNVKHASADNIVVTIHKGIPLWLQNLAEIEKEIEKVYSDDVSGMGITYLKANLLQYVEVLSFVTKFSRKLLIFLFVSESAEYPDSGIVFEESLTPFEIEWLQTNMMSFCTAFNVATLQPQYVRTSLSNIPDVVATQENAQSMESTVGAAKLDPFQMRLIPIKLNPIYHIRMMVAEWQTKRFKAAQEDLKVLQLHRLNLEKIAEGKSDAKLQKELHYVENRIQGLTADIAKMEKDYA